LGNQALMRASDNSDLKSATFADKKQTYSSSPTFLRAKSAIWINGMRRASRCGRNLWRNSL
jgi:hypothetical protein